MQIYKMSPTIMSNITHSLSTWQTTNDTYLLLWFYVTSPIRIKRGILQGDSLSPLLFCMSLAPLCNLLNTIEFGYDMDKERVNHPLYMDDLKLYSKNCRKDNIELKHLYNTKFEFFSSGDRISCSN